MDSANQPGRTLGQSLGWVNTLLDYTDKVCQSVPETELDARFTDPAGKYFFSARELMMHIADTRWNVLGWINGGDNDGRVFQVEFGGHEKPWEFKDGVGKGEILRSLADGRAALEKELARPATDMLTVTPAMRNSFEQRIAGMKEAGQDTAELEAAGPSCLANMLTFLSAHEQAHRGELQWLLRTRGADVFRII